MWKNRNKPGSNSDKTNIHHKITKQYSGSNHSDNLIEMKVTAHNWLHAMFWNSPFHQQVEKLIKIMWPTVNSILTDWIQDVIHTIDIEDMYNPKCIKNFDEFIKWVNRSRND